MKYGLPPQTLHTLYSIFQKYPGIRQVILYGSRAKGKFRNGSDIDLTLKVDSTFSQRDILTIAGDFDDSNIPYLVDVCVYDTLTNQDLIDHIDRVGKVLYPE